LRIAEAYPDLYLLETSDWAFDVAEFAEDGNCDLKWLSGTHNQIDTDSRDRQSRIKQSPYSAAYDVSWQGQKMQLLIAGVQGSNCRTERQFILAPNREIAEAFFLAVCEWNAEVRGEVLVFSEGWHKDAALFHAIKSSTLDSLILEGSLKEEIKKDFLDFFQSKEAYDQYGIPWKRGVLLLGPPGNGKTHCIKALINLTGLPCLYVRSFQHQYSTDNASIRAVFHRARETAPCILVLEDLDSMLTDENRSYFLNELDGFASNSGIMVVGTTNHPERLDPAILERPSRFDRKYTFNLPDLDCRHRYLMMFSRKLDAALHLSDGDAAMLAGRTEGFSFAYLRELFLSGMMAWIHGTDKAFPEILDGIIDTLLAQMHTAHAEASNVDARSKPRDEMQRYMSRWMSAGVGED